MSNPRLSSSVSSWALFASEESKADFRSTLPFSPHPCLVIPVHPHHVRFRSLWERWNFGLPYRWAFERLELYRRVVVSLLPSSPFSRPDSISPSSPSELALFALSDLRRLLDRLGEPRMERLRLLLREWILLSPPIEFKLTSFASS